MRWPLFWFSEGHLAFVQAGLDQWQAKIHIALGFLASWTIDKHRFTLYLVNQWQEMTHLNQAQRPGEPMTSSVWVLAHERPPPSLIPTLEKTLYQILPAERYG